MALPTFNGFSLQDGNWITERITFKGYASRDVITARINRREGIKLLATEFGSKEVTLDGRIISSGVANLQLLLDNAKTALTKEEGDLVIETGRTFTATVTEIQMPDQPENQSTNEYHITFTLSNPYAVGAVQTVGIPITSGVFTISGTITISGSLFARPTFTYTPPSNTGNTLIRRLDLYSVQTGQTTTISGFGSGTNLSYQNAVTINLDTFLALESSSLINMGGAFPRFEPGVNNFTLTASGRAFPGGTLSVSYQPRYL